MINGTVFRNELYMARRSFLVSTVVIVVLMATFAGLSELLLESTTGDMIIQLFGQHAPRSAASI